MRVVRHGTGAGSITLYDLEPTPDRLCEDIADGLSRSPKKLPPKYFYDERGARLFERITELDAYYPTRTEIGILLHHAAEIAERIGPHTRLVEFGSGSSEKTRILLRHLHDPIAYIPVDISRAQLVEFALQVAESFPSVQVTPVCADYTAEFPLPAPGASEVGRCIAYFPGSTLGNFEPVEAEEFLLRVRRLVGLDGGFLLGLDLRKDPRIIERAYDDPEGITAAFNLNLLARVNRECGADFDLDRFRHHAFYDPVAGRIEMRLISTVNQTVTLRTDRPRAETMTICIEASEPITTEYSYKYDLTEFAEVAERNGWSIVESWRDPEHAFAVVFLR